MADMVNNDVCFQTKDNRRFRLRAAAIIIENGCVLFATNDIDLGVFKKYRNQGIGNILMQVAEDIARRYADTVIIGVGLHRDYGAAQRMYVKRGYIPDGSGLWYQGRQLDPYAEMKNDDEAVLYMYKKLS